MEQYAYSALDASGKRIQGQIKAQSVDAAERQLSEKNLFPTKLELVQGGKAREIAKSSAPKSGKKVSVDDVCEMLRGISVMADSGVSVIEALTAVSENASSPAIQEIARSMKNDILGGKTLSQSMLAFPRAFPEIVCNMVAVADDSGQRGEALNNVIEYLDRSNTVRKNVIGAMIYPGILMGASGIAFLALITVILPTFNEAFSSMGVKLPWYTTMLMHIGTFIRDNTLLTLGLVFGGFFGGKRLLRVPKISQAVQLFLIRMPVIGPILTQLATNRALRTMSSLLSTSVPIIETLGYAASVANHIPLQRSFDQVKQLVGNGATVAEAMGATKAFSPMVIQMVAVGERSGRLAEMLKMLSGHAENLAERRIKAAVSLLEPLVIIGMGLVVGLITVSILMPLFSINNNIK